MSMPSCVEIGNFYPRPPRGGRPAVAGIPRQVCEQISIHALREEGDGGIGPHPGEIEVISIHALREEGDSYAYRWTSGPQHFYPRPPRGGRPSRQIPTISAPDNFYPRPPRGGRPSSQLVGTMLPKFLSTPSARRATQSSTGQSCRNAHFYPRPPRGGRHGWESDRETIIDHFYPRPPRGGRLYDGGAEECQKVFLSTPSARRATFFGMAVFKIIHCISIHALREEGDIFAA